MSSADLNNIDSFGSVSAEDDNILLDYFISTDSVKRVRDGGAFIVLGRKGSGKTAIVRHFTEGVDKQRSRALNLRNYPWNVHASRIDRGADAVDAYVASWRYLVAIELAVWALEKSRHNPNAHQKPLIDFLTENYGGPHPNLSDIIRPKTLKTKGFIFNPQILGNSLGSIDLERGDKNKDLGLELETLTSALLKSATTIIKEINLGEFLLHFDELDAGLDNLDDTRKRMVVGLILALRNLRRDFRDMEVDVKPILYLRTDIWDDLAFSDKNKITQSLAETIEWNPDTLKQLVEERLKAKFNTPTAWEDVIDNQLMRGSQPKWNHIISRTLKRPRDVIQFLNIALKVAKRRQDAIKLKTQINEPLKFQNKDIVNSRPDYSAYLKKELDDEILPHWPKWDEAMQAISKIGTETFSLEIFDAEYALRKSTANPFTMADALKSLHKFSTIGYRTRSGYGGSKWVFMYEEPDRGWDAHATQFKVHPGLKEHAGLREGRK
ncbi:P-loop ATPase, Sll1717 family [Paracoccus sulfuroxidans]|uniref:ATPase n=1 Tax=Paracoccus sulfuroxidans TaxID=384678 RepID=A0A562NXU1_9RHOB|nr:hypothetical protein [Paracoccus sulfuroxidans]TWI36975.1 hypothetical protein IQ24_00765 [Paracoccus sulfuroxidans]